MRGYNIVRAMHRPRWHFDFYAVCGVVPLFYETLEHAWARLNAKQLTVAVMRLGGYGAFYSILRAWYGKAPRSWRVPADYIRRCVPVPDEKDLATSAATHISGRWHPPLNFTFAWELTRAGKRLHS